MLACQTVCGRTATEIESKVEQGCGCDLKVLSTMREDNIGSALIPKELGEEMKALKATADGNCLFNSASILLVGDESASHMLRLLTAVELFLNPQYYANHSKLTEAKTFSSFSDTTLFSLLLSDSGQKSLKKKVAEQMLFKLRPWQLANSESGAHFLM